MTATDIAILKSGDHVRTGEDSIARVLAPSEDGNWVRVRYIASADSAIIGSEDLCSADEIAPACGALARNADAEVLWCVLSPAHDGEHVWRNILCKHIEEDERLGLCEHDHDPAGQ